MELCSQGLNQNPATRRNANFALEHAKGKYFIRLDADDRLDPNKLLVLSHYLDLNEKTSAVFPGYYRVDETGTFINYVSRSNHIFNVEHEDKEPHGACATIRIKVLHNLSGYKNILILNRFAKQKLFSRSYAVQQAVRIFAD